MTTAVETLTKLSRRMTISVPMDSIEKEVEARLKKLSRTVKMAGFRPGKVPLKMVAQQYGYQVQNEVLNDKVGQAFNEAASENQLRIAGMPKMEPKAGEAQPEGAVEFDAVFEIYPDVLIGDFASVDVEKVGAAVSDTEVNKTIDILRKQRVQYIDAAEGETAQSEDKVTVDFVGKLDDVAFPGGTANDYDFVLGQGRMLPEFEAAATGLKVGESKSFPLSFPEDYHGKDVAGKTATFTITMKKIAKPQLPELNDEFAKTLGIEDGDLAKMREDIKTNLEREVKKRTQLRTKESVMEGLIKVAEFDVPAALIEADIERLRAQAHSDMQSRGMDPKNINLPAELFSAQAERRVRLGLILAELVKQHNLAAKPEQLKAAVEEFAQSYENPMEVIRWYYSDPKRLGEVEALVLEDNVVEFVLSKAKVTEKALGFEELMGAQGQQ